MPSSTDVEPTAGSTDVEPTTESTQQPKQIAVTGPTKDGDTKERNIAMARIGSPRPVSKRLQKLRAMRDQMDMSSGSASGTFVGGKLQKPGIEVPMNPIKATNVSTPYSSDDMPEDVIATNTDTTKDTTNAPSVTQKAATQMSAQEEANTTTLADVNNTLLQLLDSQNLNNRTAKKQQRSIEGLEI